MKTKTEIPMIPMIYPGPEKSTSKTNTSVELESTSPARQQSKDEVLEELENKTGRR